MKNSTSDGLFMNVKQDGRSLFLCILDECIVYNQAEPNSSYSPQNPYIYQNAVGR